MLSVVRLPSRLRSTVVFLGVVLTLVFVSTNCGDSDGTSSTTAGTTTGTTTGGLPEGETVDASDGSAASMVLPLGETAEGFAVDPLSDAPESPADTELVGTAYAFGPVDTTFSSNASLTLPFTSGGDETRLVVFRSTAASGEGLEPYSSALQVDEGSVTFLANELGVYVVGRVSDPQVYFEARLLPSLANCSGCHAGSREDAPAYLEGDSASDIYEAFKAHAPETSDVDALYDVDDPANSYIITYTRDETLEDPHPGASPTDPQVDVIVEWVQLEAGS